MPVRNFDAPEGRVLNALRELREAIKGLGTDSSPIIKLELTADAYDKMDKHVMQECKHGASATTLDDGGEGYANDGVVWSDITIHPTVDTDYRIIRKHVFDTDIAEGYDLSPIGRTHWWGLRILKCEHLENRGMYELSLAKPRERFRDTRLDEPSRREVELQEQATQLARQIARNAARATLDDYAEVVNRPATELAFPTVQNAATANTVRDIDIIAQAVAPTHPPRYGWDISSIRVTREQLAAYEPTFRAMEDTVLYPPQPRDAAPDPVDPNPARTERLSTRAPTYAAEAQATAHITSPRR